MSAVADPAGTAGQDFNLTYDPTITENEPYATAHTLALLGATAKLSFRIHAGILDELIALSEGGASVTK